jgi:DNA (cytosine-5)-methyltransferase 1
MGVPQARERIFFIARRKDLNLPRLQPQFEENPICFGAIVDKNSTSHKKLRPSILQRRPYVEYGDQSLKFADAKFRRLETYNAFFSSHILYDHSVPGTLTAAGTTVYYNEQRNLNDLEYKRMSSFPLDFDF